mmetsp:Transcript_68591/g.125097  ORF Transcript_68591/g.125097 Transcript_68591/m.125097 type:complete len:108 (-) Transcript_68591:48-371(-)
MPVGAATIEGDCARTAVRPLCLFKTVGREPAIAGLPTWQGAPGPQRLKADSASCVCNAAANASNASNVSKEFGSLRGCRRRAWPTQAIKSKASICMVKDVERKYWAD